MIYVKASKQYFSMRFNYLLQRIENVNKNYFSNMNVTPVEVNQFMDRTWAEIGRLILYASEMLPEGDFIDLMAALEKDSGVKARKFRYHFIKSLLH